MLVAAGLMVATPILSTTSSEAASGVEVGIGDAAVWEGDATNRTITFPITLSQAAASTVTVMTTVAPGSATSGVDYKASYGTTKTITFNAGQTFKALSILALPDTIDESDEAFSVTLSSPTGGAVLGRSIASGGIYDDDPGTGIRIGAGDTSVVETDSGKPKLKFWVTLSGPAAGTVTANVAVAGGTATAATDYKTVNKTLAFNPGQVKKPITVVVYGDLTDEPDETAILTLSGVSGATLSDATATGTIHDDDSAINVQTATLQLGPFNLAPEGQAGWESEASQGGIPRPSGAFGLVGARFDIVTSGGASVASNLVHLHHVVFLDGSRTDSLCPTLPNRFVGSGSERTPVSFDPQYAYKVGSADQWTAIWHVMNMSTTARTVYIQYKIDYITGTDLTNAKPLTSYYYDVDNCWGDSAYEVPGGGGSGSIHTKSISYTAPRSGVRMYSGGHLHAGGIDVYLTQNGNEICRPTAIYDGFGVITQITTCNTPVNVTAGMNIGLTARYSNENNIPAAMGISVSYVWDT
jgi:hypothetical protein